MILVHVLRMLNKRKVRYLVVGGVASILYGNPRFTNDLDLMADLKEGNLRKLVAAFKDLRFVPRVPVKAEDFAVEANRVKWIREKNMLAFTFINPKNPLENIDILLTSPIPFEKAYKRKKIFKSGNTSLPTISPDDLITIKKKAGRPQDLHDVAILKAALRKTRRTA